MKKSNAARFLDRLAISYNLIEYKYDAEDLGAEKAAEELALPLEAIYKTLVVRGDCSGVIIVSIPGGRSLDLKLLAGASGDRSVKMVPLKEIPMITGYKRGAVSPLGMKRKYPFYLDQSALRLEKIYISAGIRGMEIALSPQDLITVAEAAVTPLVR